MMKFLVIACLLASISSAFGQDCNSYRKDALCVYPETIHVIATFSDVDYFSSFSHTGDFLWEIPFGSRIVSWRKENNNLFILSQVRNGSAFWLSCLNATNGIILWEKGVFAPKSQRDDQDLITLE